MAKSTAIANVILDAMYNGGASGSVVIGAQTLTLPFKLKFLSTTSSAGSAGTEWSTSGGYTAGGVSMSGAWGTAASGGAKSNTAAITVTNAPAGTWAGCEIVDSTGTPVRLNFAAVTGGSKTINSGDTVTVAIGDLDAAES